jgi:hypothetical protein
VLEQGQPKEVREVHFSGDSAFVVRGQKIVQFKKKDVFTTPAAAIDAMRPKKVFVVSANSYRGEGCKVYQGKQVGNGGVVDGRGKILYGTVYAEEDKKEAFEAAKSNVRTKIAQTERDLKMYKHHLSQLNKGAVYLARED